MKNLFLILLVAAFAFNANGQKTKVTESTEKIGNGKNNCLVVNIAEANADDIIKEWKDKMKGFGAKVSGKSEMMADDATILAISSNTIDVYSVTEQKDGYVKFMVAFDLGGAYLNSKEHTSGYKAAEKMIYDFAIAMAKDAVNKQLNAQKEMVSKTEKNIKDLEKENEKLAKDIEDYKKRIEDAEKKTEENKSSIETENKNLEEQNSALKDLEKKFNAVD
ncbi:MAG: hypothetical protein CVU11_11245 [Bacteroidetes bacterium HGW-Bacteroidetes-6]|jgi:valyl-tRNA synthetase|nr:MAG: hypothetical protein CVU11_11245 [Bacteroidetes bacterium HGW-Bacteroidetes-6]